MPLSARDKPIPIGRELRDWCSPYSFSAAFLTMLIVLDRAKNSDVRRANFVPLIGDARIIKTCRDIFLSVLNYRDFRRDFVCSYATLSAMFCAGVANKHMIRIDACGHIAPMQHMLAARDRRAKQFVGNAMSKTTTTGRYGNLSIAGWCQTTHENPATTFSNRHRHFH